jgi:cold shock CspA family protein
MPEPAQHVQTNIDAKADECELVAGTVLWFDGRRGFCRPDCGGLDVYLGAPELLRAGIKRLEVGSRICFEVRKATHGRRPWAARIHFASEATA